MGAAHPNLAQLKCALVSGSMGSGMISRAWRPERASPITSPDTDPISTRRFLLAPRGRVIRRRRVLLAQTHRAHICRGRSLRDQVVPDCVGPFFGKLQVVFVGSDAVRVAFQLESQPWICQQNSGDLG